MSNIPLGISNENVPVAMQKALFLATTKPSATALTLADAAAVAAQLSEGDQIYHSQVVSGLNLGGKMMTVKDAGSAEARPAEVANFIVHVNSGSGGLYLKDSTLIDVPSDVILPSGFYPLFGYVNGRVISYTRPSDILNVSTWVKLYVDVKSGDNANDGLTPATAKKSISSAIDLAIINAVPTRIMIMGGVYSRFNSIHATNAQKVLTAPISLEAVYGRVETGPFETLTWTKTVGQDYVYQTSRSNAQQAFNTLLLDEKGNYTEYTAATSISDCNDNAGSWYTDDSITYIHVHNNAPADDRNARVYLQARALDFMGDFDIYLNGIDLTGGTTTNTARFSGGSTNTILVNDCTFKYCKGGDFASGYTAIDGVGILGCKIFAAFNSDASFHSKDGWNFHEESGVLPFGYMVDCTGYENGLVVSTGSANGITAHDGICGIEMGGDFQGSAGGNVAHVDIGTTWLHVDTTAGNSNGDTIWGGTTDGGAFQSGDGAKTYLYYCTDVGAAKGLNAGSNGGEIVIAGHKGQGSKAGTVTTLF